MTQESNLEMGSSLGIGGTSELLGVTLDGEELVYKKYFDAPLDPAQAAVLTALVDWAVANVPESDTGPLSRCNWPRRLVTDADGGCLGILLPTIPSRFFSGEGEGHLVHFDQMAMPYGIAATDGTRYFEPPERLAALGGFLEVLLGLHEHDVEVLDVQERNVIVDPYLDVHVLDCDSFRGPWGAFQSTEAAPSSYSELTHDDIRRQDLGRFAALAARVLQEDWLTYDISDSNMRFFMPEDERRLLRQLIALEDVPLDRVRQLQMDWTAGVTGETMTVRRDDVMFAVWQRAAAPVLPTAQPAPTGSDLTPAPPTSGSGGQPGALILPPDPDGSRNSNRTTAIILGISLGLIILLIILAVVLL